MVMGWGGRKPLQCNNVNIVVVIIRLVFGVSGRTTFWPPLRQSRKRARTPICASWSQVVASCRRASVRAHMSCCRLLQNRQPRDRRPSVSTWLSEVLRRPRDHARVSWPCWCPPRRLKLYGKKWINLCIHGNSRTWRSRLLYDYMLYNQIHLTVTPQYYYGDCEPRCVFLVSTVV